MEYNVPLLVNIHSIIVGKSFVAIAEPKASNASFRTIFGDLC